MGQGLLNAKPTIPVGQTSGGTLHGSHFPMLTYSQEDLHRNLRENIVRQTSRLGSKRLPGSVWNSPAHHPLGTAHRRLPTLGRLVPTAKTIFNSSIREPDRIELPPSSPSPTLPWQPIPARRLRGGFAGVEQDFSKETYTYVPSRSLPLSFTLLPPTYLIAEDCCIRDPVLGNKLHKLSHTIASNSDELKKFWIVFLSEKRRNYKIYIYIFPQYFLSFSLLLILYRVRRNW